MNPDVLYEKCDGYVTKSYVEDQHNWLRQYQVDAIRLGRMSEKFPALQKSWEEFKLIYELCKSQDDLDRQEH